MARSVPPIPDSYWLPGGRVAAVEYPGHLDAENARAKLQKMLDAGISSFVDLTTPDDRLVPYDGILRELAPDAVYRRMSIPDRGVKGREEMAAILDHIAAELERGALVYVRCQSRLMTSMPSLHLLPVAVGGNHGGEA